jgi:hypothetical protein
VRNAFALLASLFDVVGKYDGEVRWKSGATGARDRFFLASEQIRHGDAEGYAAARAALNDLQDLLGGELTADAPAASHPVPDAADRVALMRRLELAVDTRLSDWLSSRTELHKHISAIRHESEVMAMLSGILTEESMPDAADPDYRALAESLRESALQLGKERTLEDLTAAARIMAVIHDTCERCHETYR